ATTVMIYKAMKSEVCLDGLEDEGKQVAYPYCINKTDMTALVPFGDDAWAPGAFGILEPQPEKSEVIMPEDIDLVICPCTAFDKNGNRMGMGAGYYDRFLGKCVNAKIIAVAFDCQNVDTVPSEPHDVRMQKVYTEKSIYEF
ncbi:MAG: 5-formyltetrahydrofolate cyclo-ligase, partial [Firmicutes bacterium]|nr:5-formyltetrahydrofolate cyclo-ligase [Bacillota bacterium]